MMYNIRDLRDADTLNSVLHSFLQRGDSVEIPVTLNSERVVNTKIIVQGTRANSRILLRGDVDGETNELLATCGVVYQVQANGKRQEITCNPYHCPQEVRHHFLRGGGIMTTLLTMREHCSGILQFETTQPCDLFYFLVNRGYSPIGTFYEGTPDMWHGTSGMMELNDREYRRIVTFLRLNRFKRDERPIYPRIVRLQYLPEEARELLEKIEE